MMPLPPGPGLSALAKAIIITLASPFIAVAAFAFWSIISAFFANDDEEHY